MGKTKKDEPYSCGATDATKCLNVSIEQLNAAAKEMERFLKKTSGYRVSDCTVMEWAQALDFPENLRYKAYLGVVFFLKGHHSHDEPQDEKMDYVG